MTLLKFFLEYNFNLCNAYSYINANFNPYIRREKMFQSSIFTIFEFIVTSKTDPEKSSLIMITLTP